MVAKINGRAKKNKKKTALEYPHIMFALYTMPANAVSAINAQNTLEIARGERRLAKPVNECALVQLARASKHGGWRARVRIHFASYINLPASCAFCVVQYIQLPASLCFLHASCAFCVTRVCGNNAFLALVQQQKSYFRNRCFFLRYFSNRSQRFLAVVHQQKSTLFWR